MFGLDAGSAAAPETGYLVTNHLNLMYMLAGGLVLPPAGFGEKYYADTLNYAPGWIPLFTGNPRWQAVEYSLTGAQHLRPCIVKLSLQGLSGPVVVPGRDGLEDRRFPREAGRPELIFVPAPLPTSAIEGILFRSAEERKACEQDAMDYGNVPWADFKTKTEKIRFSNSSGEQWSPDPVPNHRDVPLRAAQATGGIMAMLRLMASCCNNATAEAREPLGVSACRMAFDPPAEPAPEIADTILADLTTWTSTGRAAGSFPAAHTTASQQAVWRWLFWRTVERLADEDRPTSHGSSEGVLLDLLRNAFTEIPPGLQDRIARLGNDLESLTGLAGSTVSELFERYRSPLSRAMLLLFLRERCTDLLEFKAAELNDEDRLAAAVLFGAREGWMSLPLTLRGDAATSMAISHRMAAMSHRIASTGIDLGPAPERTRPIAEQFLGDWDPVRSEAALRLAQDQNWDCIQTRVTLGHGDYRLIVTRSGTEIVFQGQPNAVASEVDRHQFLRRLAEGIRTEPALEPRLLALVRVDSPTRAGRRRSRRRRRNVRTQE